MDRDEKIEHLVPINNATSEQSVDVTTLTPSASYTSIHGGGPDVTATADGVASVTVPALSAVVLKADRMVAASAGEVALDVADGAAVSGNTAAMTASIEKNRWAETTFAMRTFDDAAAWSTIGLAEDDTPRVYTDVEALTVGTPVEVRAVSTGADTVAGDSALVWVGQDFALTPPIMASSPPRLRFQFPAATTQRWVAPATGSRNARTPH